jgi:hypothetical protein
MYTTRNFPTKKALKEAVAAWNEYAANPALWQLKYAAPSSVGVVAGLVPQVPSKVTYYQPNDMGFSPLPMNGLIYLEGPHYPKPHTWYAEATVKDGIVVKVR